MARSFVVFATCVCVCACVCVHLCEVWFHISGSGFSMQVGGFIWVIVVFSCMWVVSYVIVVFQCMWVVSYG